MAQLSARDWLLFSVGLTAWRADAFHFHALYIKTVNLAKYYDRPKIDIAITTTLARLLRSVGTVFWDSLVTDMVVNSLWCSL